MPAKKTKKAAPRSTIAKKNRRDATDRRALAHLMDFLAIEGASGNEAQVAKTIEKKLARAGAKKAWVKYDTANRRIPGDYEIGNLIVKVPGTFRAPRRLFMGHMDTVPLCRGAVPVLRGDRIVPKGKTALGGDNRTSIGALVTVLETILTKDLERPPLTFLFTVGEEVGLWGARMVKLKDLGNPRMGFNVDSGDPHRVIIGATGADRWYVHVNGRSSHAGVRPEDGISASLIASRAIAGAAADGWFGKIEKRGGRGTSNVGVLEGGEATNQVTDHVYVKGESRSHSKPFLNRITKAWEKAFKDAAKSVRNDSGACGSVDFHAERDYEAFVMNKQAPPVKLAEAIIRDQGGKPVQYIANGGLDANYLNAKGVPTVTLGAGQHNAHTIDEYVDVPEYLEGQRVLLGLATARQAN